jgi:molecular chaperone Hsp33
MKEQDCLRRFLFEDLGVRGEWVRLQTSWQQAKQHQTLIPAVESQLGQALAAVALLSATIKFTGAMILQAQGQGALRAVVAQSSHNHKIRGLVRCDADIEAGSLSQMMGAGHLVLTIESEKGHPYQGVVPLEGDCLADVLQTYFTQSEQLKTRLWLFANNTYAAGLFLQKLPTQTGYEADWERIEALANTITEAELFDLDCETMLYRLFNQEKIRVFAAQAVEFSCHCSAKKIADTLHSLGRVELEAILAEHGVIKVDCEFCGQQYHFNKTDVAAVFASPSAVD